MPALFLGHGSPMNVLEDNIYTRAWGKLGQTLPRPKAIVVISAHWFTRGTGVTAMETPKTIHDFGGFPQALFDLPHAHAQDLMRASSKTLPSNIKRTAILLTLGISLHNFPEGVATYVTASSNLELGLGIALAVALHNIPEGLAVAAPVYAATGSKRKAVMWAGISGLAEILGGVLAWLILGSLVSPVVMAAIMAAVAGIMVALSVDELMPLAKEIDPHNNPSYGVLCGMSVMGLSLVLLQSIGFAG